MVLYESRPLALYKHVVNGKQISLREFTLETHQCSALGVVHAYLELQIEATDGDVFWFMLYSLDSSGFVSIIVLVLHSNKQYHG